MCTRAGTVPAAPVPWSQQHQSAAKIRNEIRKPLEMHICIFICIFTHAYSFSQPASLQTRPTIPAYAYHYSTGPGIVGQVCRDAGCENEEAIVTKDRMWAGLVLLGPWNRCCWDRGISAAETVGSVVRSVLLGPSQFWCSLSVCGPAELELSHSPNIPTYNCPSPNILVPCMDHPSASPAGAISVLSSVRSYRDRLGLQKCWLSHVNVFF